MKGKDVSCKTTKKAVKATKHKSKFRTKARRKRRKLKTKHYRTPLLRKSYRTKSSSSFRPSSSFDNPMFNSKSGSCYWLNYSNVFKWKDHHLVNRDSSSYFLPWQQFGLDSQKRSDCWNNETDWKDNAHFNPCKHGQGFQLNEKIEDEESSDDDLVVTDEMMEFLEISMRHKINLKVEKEKLKKNEEIKTRSERDVIEECHVPEEEVENERRLKEMSFLYGKEAPKIHGMETALQLTFNHQIDLFNPQHWPIHPFTMQFQKQIF